MILVTGATGVVGSRFVLELLRSTSLHLILPIRRKSEPSHRRLEEILQVYQPDFQFHKWQNRLTLLEADLLQENLGLTEAQISHFKGRVNAIIHAAAKTDLVTTARSAQVGNVLTTENILKFATVLGHPLFCMISSYSIFGDYLFKRGTILNENHFDVGQKFPQMPYQESKFLAETTVRKSRLPWMIIRLGQVFGDIQTAAYPVLPSIKSGFFNSFVGLIANSGIAPVSGYRFDITPVDFIARGITALLENGSPGCTYHLCNPSPPTLADLADWLEDQDYQLQRIPVPEYVSLFRGGALHAPDRIHRSTATAFLNLWFQNSAIDFTSDAQACSAQTMKSLAKTGVEFPNILPSHIGSYLKFLNLKMPAAPKSNALVI